MLLKRGKKSRGGKSRSLIDVGGRLRRKIGEADQQRDLDPIKTRYLFLRSFKNVLKRKKANSHGAGRREGLKEAETPESRLVEDEEEEGEKERD